ncbi:hypothetical protein COOONC_27414 [Cooperia oncophora]
MALPVQRACEIMRQVGFVQVETVEIVHRTHKVVELARQSLADFDASGDSAVIQGTRSGSDRARKRKLEEDTKEYGFKFPIIECLFI